MANHYLLMPKSDSHTAFDVEAAMSLWGHDSFSGRDWVDTASGLSVRSKNEDRHVSADDFLCEFCFVDTAL